MLSISALANVVLMLIVAGVIFGLLIWLIEWCKTPEPFKTVARVIIGIVAVVIVIGALLQLVGGQPLFRP